MQHCVNPTLLFMGLKVWESYLDKQPMPDDGVFICSELRSKSAGKGK